jgi:acyl-CoA thioesterase I
MRSRFKSLVHFFIAVSVLMCALVAMPVNAANQAKPQTIVIFGDSLSSAYGITLDEGWVSLLQQRLAKQKRNDQVVNASSTGETTSGGLSRFSDMLKTHRPSILIIELGGNDGLRGLSADETYKNLNAMIQQAKKNKIKVLLLGMKIPPNYGFKYSQQFSENYQTLAKKHKIQHVPFFLEGVAGNPNLIQVDGIHPTAKAQPQLLENVWPTLLQMLKH